MICNVESFRPELELDALRDREVLEQRDVDGADARSHEDVSAQRTGMDEYTIDGRHFRYRAHVEVLPGIARMGGEGADQVRPALRRTRCRQSERQPALYEENAVELPPAYQ